MVLLLGTGWIAGCLGLDEPTQAARGELKAGVGVGEARQWQVKLGRPDGRLQSEYGVGSGLALGRMKGRGG
jgi:hypothetical protein